MAGRSSPIRELAFRTAAYALTSLRDLPSPGYSLRIPVRAHLFALADRRLYSSGLRAERGPCPSAAPALFIKRNSVLLRIGIDRF